MASVAPPSSQQGRARTPDGAELAWTAHGSGPPLLLVSGQGSGQRGWRHLLPLLTETHRVVTFDHRGVATSTSGRDPFTTRRFAGDAVVVLQDAGVGSAAVLAHSMGGRVAQWLAIDHPRRVTRLVLVATTGGDSRGGPRSPGADAALTSGQVEAMAPYFFGARFRGEHPQVVADFFARDTTGPARRAHLAASRGHDAWEQLRAISAPTLVVHGRDDEVTPPEAGRLLAEMIPGAQVALHGGQVHCLHLESRLVQTQVAAFLSSGPRPVR